MDCAKAVGARVACPKKSLEELMTELVGIRNDFSAEELMSKE